MPKSNPKAQNMEKVAVAQELAKWCRYCSAWQELNDGLGYCRRYGLRTRSWEWCETWDKSLSVPTSLANLPGLGRLHRGW